MPKRSDETDLNIHFYLHIGFGSVDNIGVTLLNIFMTIGTWLSAIGTCVGAFAAINAIRSADKIANKQNELSERIANRQSDQEDLQIRISLFDKRYEIYQCFMKYWDIANEFFVGDADKVLDKLLSLDKCLFGKSDDSDVRHIYDECVKIKQENNREVSDEERNAVSRLRTQINIMKMDDVNILGQCRFCYENIDESEKLISFVNNIYATGLELMNRENMNYEKYFNEVKSVMDKMKNIKDEFEKQLPLLKK